MTVNGRHETSFAYREVRYGNGNTAENNFFKIGMAIPTM